MHPPMWFEVRRATSLDLGPSVREKNTRSRQDVIESCPRPIVGWVKSYARRKADACQREFIRAGLEMGNGAGHALEFGHHRGRLRDGLVQLAGPSKGVVQKDGGFGAVGTQRMCLASGD